MEIERKLKALDAFMPFTMNSSAPRKPPAKYTAPMLHHPRTLTTLEAYKICETLPPASAKNFQASPRASGSSGSASGHHNALRVMCQG